MISDTVGTEGDDAGCGPARLLDERHMLMRGSGLIWTVVGVLLIVALVIYIF
jgi:hypothetical protein